MSCLINSLNYDEPRNDKNKAHSAGQVGTFPRDATRLLAFLGHLKGAPLFSEKGGAYGFVAPLGNGATMAGGTRLASDPSFFREEGRVIIQRINETGH